MIEESDYVSDYGILRDENDYSRDDEPKLYFTMKISKRNLFRGAASAVAMVLVGDVWQVANASPVGSGGLSLDTSNFDIYPLEVIKTNIPGGPGVPVYPYERITGPGPWTVFGNNQLSVPYYLRLNAVTLAGIPNNIVIYAYAPGYTGTNVVTYQDVIYGCYLDGATTLISCIHATDITILQHTYTVNLVTSSVNNQNFCFDFFLFNDNTGTTAQVNCEIQVFLSCSNSAYSGFISGLQIVGGSGTAGNPTTQNYYTSAALGNSASIQWEVTYQAANSQNAHYFQFRPTDGTHKHDGSDTIYLTGTQSIDLGAMIAWLQTQNLPGSSTVKCLTGQEYYCGHSFGFELVSAGPAQLNITSQSCTYTPDAAAGGTSSNVFVYPANLQDPAWNIINSVTASSALTVVETTAVNGYHFIGQKVPQPATGTHKFQLKLYVYSPATSGLTRPYVAVLIQDPNGANGANGWFNISTGTVGTTYGFGTASLGSASITSQGGGIYLITFSATLPALGYSGGIAEMLFGPCTANSVGGYTGVTTDGIQLSQAPICTMLT